MKTVTQREHQVMTKAEIGVLWLQAKEHQRLSANHQKLGRIPLQVSEGAWPYQHLDFRLLAPEL